MKPYTKLVILYMLMVSVYAEDNITLTSPINGTSCVTLDDSTFHYIPKTENIVSCNLYTNNSGIWHLDAIDTSPDLNVDNIFNITLSPNTILWQIQCSNQTHTLYSNNNTFILTTKRYCAVLSETSCTPSINLASTGVIKTRLSNTRRFYLENQDCNVWITNQRNEVVKSFDTMLYMQNVALQLDKEGNWINVVDKKVPLTDSNGYYVMEFTLDKSWAWYDDEYTIHVSCNGQETTCNFNATKERLPDMNEYEALGREAGGVFIVAIIMIAAIVYAVKRGKNELLH